MQLIEKKQEFNKKICTAHDDSCRYLCIDKGVMLKEICKDFLKLFRFVLAFFSDSMPRIDQPFLH